jgi:hypothetical protein
MSRINTTNPRTVRRLWQECGGQVFPVRRTGEERWVHPMFNDPITSIRRRNDLPAIVLCRLNRLL